jgi:uncharacterized protein (DUF58 family)
MSRSGGVGILAVCVVAAAWLLGSTALAVVGVGLGLATVAARLWAGLVATGLAVVRRPVEGPPVEGDALTLEADVEGRTWLASRLEWRDRVGTLGDHGAVVGPGGRARIELPRMPRGRYRLGPGRLRVTDPLGLTRVDVAVERKAAVTVRPRVPELDTLFTETGGFGEGGRRALVRRPSGLEPHGVREYQEGEALRAVHWPTSARRGELMVRELEDAPRDSIAVVLDVDAGAVAGARGDSSLDDAVRAAAAIVRTHALRSRRALLVIGAAQPRVHSIRSVGRDWDDALDDLAAVEPSAATPLGDLVAARGPLGSVPELVVVTARPEAVADALVARTAVGRSCALVAVDAPTYAGRPPAVASPVLLRLSAAGVALAVLRHGAPLVEALGGLRARAVG